MMSKSLFHRGVLIAVIALLSLAAISRSAERAEPKLAHMVFFTLKDSSKAARETLVASCQKYLSDHEGAVYFSVGTIAEDSLEPNVGVRDFDVALHLVFETKAAEKKYLDSPRHKEFVERNKDTWSKVRVFDSYLTASAR
jgi:hypothetical protein